MPKERKIRIRNAAAAEAALLRRGARFTHELRVTDTYLKQPEGAVLKISENENGAFLVRLRKEGGTFIIESEKPISDAEKRALLKKRTVRSILKKRRRFFAFETYTININLIEGVGDFLVVEGESVPLSVFADLGIKKPEFVTVPFDRLPRS